MDWKRNWKGATLLLSVSFFVGNAAVHIKEGKEKVIQAGQSFSLTCEGNGWLNWNYPIDVKNRVKIKEIKNRSTLEVDDSTTNDTGYYECVDDRNPPSVTSIYVYVHDEDNLFLFSNNTFITAMVGDDITVPCRATHPEAEVILTQNSQPIENVGDYNPRVGFLLKNVSISYHGYVCCEASYKGINGQAYYYLVVKVPTVLPKPIIEGANVLYALEGNRIHLSCTVTIEGHIIYFLHWFGPNQKDMNKTGRAIIERKNVPTSYRGKAFKTESIDMTITSLRKNDEGNYSCVIKSDFQFNKDVVQIVVVDKNDSFINFHMDGGSTIIEVNEKQHVKWAVGYEAAPSPKFHWYAPDGNKIANSSKYQITTNSMQTVLIVTNVVPSDAGIYVLSGKAGTKEKQQNLTLLVKALPMVSLFGTHDFFIYHKNYDVRCSINSYPFANITWSFKNCTDYLHCDNKEVVIWQDKMPQKNFTSDLSVRALTSGKLQCQACNTIGCKTELMNLFIANSEEGIHLSGPKSCTEGENITLYCSASIYNFTSNMTWWKRSRNESNFQQISFHKGLYHVESTSHFSFESMLYIFNTSYKEHNGEYLCKTTSLTNVHTVVDSNQINLEILVKKAPFFIHHQEEHHTFYVGEGAWLDCRVDGAPEPHANWFMNGKSLNHLGNSSRYEFHNNKQTLIIKHCEVDDAGTYQCIIDNIAGKIKRNFNITVIQLNELVENNSKGTSAAIAVVFVILLIAMGYLIWRIKKERKQVQALTAQDVTAFHEGALLSVDPDLAIDEQADLLPYDKDFEFPREKLKLGKQLGCGAFGRVVKAEAEGLKDEEKYTVVAVKMVKPHSDISHLKALMTELKILIYIGHHLNVLNLLGACTTNLIHKELLVIMEYCRYGNVHSYLQRHRDSFVNQINPVTDVIDFNIGKDAILEQSKEEISLNPSGETSKDSKVMFDNSSGQMQFTDMTGESMISTTADSTGSTTPADLRWNITYKADFKGKLANPLNTKDLLCWSYQVAMGMEYLSSLKIVHADLAARNILLAENNIVKICDFGLARNLYKNMDYKKKGQDPLPVKWMAIESIEDRIFSTKSDVWSFGVVLWEFFTLAKTPYPGMEVNEEFLHQLIKGYRMTKPEYSTHDMYRVMLGCWKTKPTDRPSFTDLVHRIGDALDNELKEHYVELNTPYVNQNTRIMSTGNNYINFNDGDNSDYIQPEFPDRLYVNMRPVGSEGCSKIDRISEEESDNPGFEGESVYLPMTK